MNTLFLSDFSVSAAAELPQVPGCINKIEAAFLASLVSAVSPNNLLEVGVASGVSTLLLLKAINRLKSSRLTSVDISDRWYYDPQREVAWVVPESGISSERLNLVLKSDALRLLESHISSGRKHLFDFVFIDANHLHPWPVLDLICCLPQVAQNSWVCLHDINLPHVNAKFPNFGPNYLFYAWAGKRLIPELEIPNIGALKLMGQVELNLGKCLDVLSYPWELPVDPDYLERIGTALANVDLPELSSEFIRVCHANNKFDSKVKK